MTIVLDSLTKRFDHTLVVNDVSLEIRDGEFFVLLGRSGSGKSTLLRLVAGLAEPDDGKILIHGRDVTALRPQDRNVGFVFQNYSIFRHMTSAANIEFGLRIRRVPVAQRRAKAEELLDVVGLAGFGERYAAQLSGGQQQRVALARALAYDPSVLLLDEPFGALDVVIRGQLRQALREVQRRLNVTTILVTHDQEEAFELADRIGVIERGRLVEVGTPEELYHKPRTEFVAGFVGGGNLLSGRSSGDHVALGSIQLPLPQDAPSHEKGEPVRVLLRPEAIELRSAASALTKGVHPIGEGRVVGTRFAGSIHRVRVEVEPLRGARQLAPTPAPGEKVPVLEAALTSSLSEDAVFSPGDVVRVGVRTLHVLAPARLRMLVGVEDPRERTPAIAFATALASRARADASLLTVASSADLLKELEPALAALREDLAKRVPGIESRLRSGESTTELLHEAQEGGHELVVVGHRASTRPSALSLGPTARDLLERAGVPVLVVPAARERITKILICTTTVGPDLPEVLLGGRIARAVGAHASVLHFPAHRASPQELAQDEGHLRRIHGRLADLGVEVSSKLGWGPAAPAVLREAELGDHDLLVVGASSSPGPRGIRRGDLAGALVERSDRPILVVPTTT